MKNVLRLLAIAALATTFALPALAQDTTGTAAAASAQDVQAKADLYKKFLDNYKGTPEQQKVAYEAGKEYLSKYGSSTEEADKKIVAFIQNWVAKYEKAAAEFNFTKAVNENPAQAFQLSREMLAQNPDNLKVYLQLVAAGIKSASSGNKSLNPDAINAARKALALIEQGKTSDSWLPFANQTDAPIGLRYYIASFSYDTAPEDAATQLLKVAQSSSPFAKEPSTYQLLGASYYNGELKKLAAEYKAKYENQPETPESKALYDKVNVVLDRVIDAYARAVALSNGKPQYAATLNAIKPVLTNLYKQRHDNSDTGLNELIASVLSKPIPVPGQEPVATPAPSSSSALTGTDGAGMTTKPVATTQPVVTGTTAKPATNTGAKPASTTPPTGAKPATPAQKPPVSKTRRG
ncbi:MAG: hypothetical protein QOE46_2923 [Acidobacteriota bacterium]|jgi:hypothetical protein|nr:hypothetical protein [Acidobacteriota bacterium]